MASVSLKALTVPYQAGETIVGPEEKGHCLFIIQSGKVRLSRPSGSGPAREIAVLGKGDLFGEGAILDGRPYGIKAEATTDCEIVEISPQTFQRLLSSHPEIAVRVMRKLATRLEAVETALAAAAGEAPRAAKTALRQEAPPTGKLCWLEVEGSGERFPLNGPEVMIGRYDPVTDHRPEVDLTEIDTRRSVSRRHARVTRSSKGWLLSEEKGVLNGTLLNGKKIPPGKPVRIKDGDVIALGVVRLTFHEE
ncbi:MAG: FHA domain-containing protein [Acidobacteria bacterium]|nr:MAG: FHA domain-containing protein [Acidobacteriota bacterium]